MNLLRRWMMVPMSMTTDKAETCVNVWCIIDGITRVVYRIAARAYSIVGTDDHKASVLKALAWSDFGLAKDLPVLERFNSSIVDESGRQRRIVGMFPSSIHGVWPTIFDDVCKALESEFPPRLIIAGTRKKVTKAALSESPYFVLTFLLENDQGELSVANPPDDE